MNIKFYNTVSENILHNFLEKGFKYSSVSSKEFIISKIQDFCPFKVTSEDNCNILIIDIGEMIVKYKLIWVQSNNISTIYHLKDIQYYKDDEH